MDNLYKEITAHLDFQIEQEEVYIKNLSEALAEAKGKMQKCLEYDVDNTIYTRLALKIENYIRDIVTHKRMIGELQDIGNHLFKALAKSLDEQGTGANNGL